MKYVVERFFYGRWNISARVSSKKEAFSIASNSTYPTRVFEDESGNVLRQNLKGSSASILNLPRVVHATVED